MVKCFLSHLKFIICKKTPTRFAENVNVTSIFIHSADSHEQTDSQTGRTQTNANE